jgi:hypothetical protein
MSVVYEVNLVIDKDINADFCAWLPGHVGELLKCPGFVDARWFSRSPEDEGQPKDDSKVLHTVHYYLQDRASLDNYLKEHAPRLRQDGVTRFGAKMSATRRVLNQIQHITHASATSH